MKFLPVLFCLLCLPALAAPVVIYDQSTYLTPPAGTPAYALDFSFSLATSFTTGGSTMTLSNILTGIVYANAGGSSGSGLSLGLFSDGGSVPGTQVASLTLQDPVTYTLDTIAPLVSWAPDAVTVLSANTTYWVVASSPVFNAYSWRMSNAVGSSRYSTGGTGGPWINTTDFLPTMQVLAETGEAPELDGSSALLPAFLAVGLLLGGRRKRATQG